LQNPKTATIYSLLASHAHLILPCEAFQVMEEHDREPKTDTFVMRFFNKRRSVSIATMGLKEQVALFYGNQMPKERY